MHFCGWKWISAVKKSEPLIQSAGGWWWKLTIGMVLEQYVYAKRLTHIHYNRHFHGCLMHSTNRCAAISKNGPTQSHAKHIIFGGFCGNPNGSIIIEFCMLSASENLCLVHSFRFSFGSFGNTYFIVELKVMNYDMV